MTSLYANLSDAILAAEVFDGEPLPLKDHFIERLNVIHTPHNAGWTKDANMAYAQRLVEQFKRLK
jgi:phosphoglycerate dehydrogenase-like enzyme